MEAKHWLEQVQDRVAGRNWIHRPCSEEFRGKRKDRKGRQRKTEGRSVHADGNNGDARELKEQVGPVAEHRPEQVRVGSSTQEEGWRELGARTV